MESDEVKKKRYYIYENIDQIKNHDQIIDLIQIKKCKFTKNNNGIFLNLSVLDEGIINMIYQIIINSLDYEEDSLNNIIEQDINIEGEGEGEGEADTAIVKSSKKETTKKKNEISMKSFTKEEQEIINFSKKYNL